MLFYPLRPGSDMHMIQILRMQSQHSVRKANRGLSNQHGMTLVELLVALAIGLVVTLAAVSALVATRRGFNTVDASSQLRENGRYASDLIQRIVVQTGFKDPYLAMTPPSPLEIAADLAGNFSSNVTGFNNASFNTGTGADVTTATTRTAGTPGYGSDVLIVRYQTARTYATSTSATSDGSMVDCNGQSITTVAANRNDRMVSIFYVDVGTDGEPSLFCSQADYNGATIGVPQPGVPILSGVENFQVLYGMDGFDSTSVVKTPFTAALDSVPQKYLRADEIVVANNTHSQATYNNWRRVRSIRIGMVLRGPVGSQQESISQTFYPFGKGQSSASSSSAGLALSNATNDPGTVFTPAADGRLREVVTFTVHLRNDQFLCSDITPNPPADGNCH